MKKMFLKCTIFLSIMFLANLTFAQDMIILKTGDEIKSKVLEITPDLVKYTKWENQEGPSYSTNKSDIFMIKYANGTKDVFNTVSSLNTNVNQNSSDKFIGKWVNNGGGKGLNLGAVVTISSAGGSLVVSLNPKSGISEIQNTGTYEDGKIKVDLPYIGQTQITYSNEDGQPHIYLIGVKLDKQ
jgi:hypothetical protein